MVHSPGKPDMLVRASDWVLVASGSGYFADPSMQDLAQPIAVPASLRTWTDDYSNLLRIIK